LARDLRDKKGVEPVIATVIITGTIIVLVTVAMIFANNLLTASIAQGDFNSAKQFMQTVAMQTDDVAWQMGQTQTVRYASTYGTMNVLNGALNYTIIMTSTTGSKQTYTFSTAIIYFYMLSSYYSVSNNYFSQVWPLQVLNPVNNGSSAPVATVFAVEKIPLNGSYIRVVAAPVIRLTNSTITTSSTSSTFYFNLYLPVLSLASSPRLSQSVTLKSNSISIGTQNNLQSISVAVSFPKSGFDNTFFHFPRTTQLFTAPQQQGLTCVAQLYAASVAVSLGVTG
jgi:uncharacterized MnhB-related membrane protein